MYVCNRTLLYPSYCHMVEYTRFLLYHKALPPSFPLSLHALAFFLNLSSNVNKINRLQLFCVI